MSGGLAALLDDVATIAKMAAASVDDVSAAAAKASAKAVGVVVDDTAVTPRYVHGFLANRELPIIRRIALGSLRNKLVFILPVALLLSEFLPWLMTPILMCGGAYLTYEGAEKVWEALGDGHRDDGTGNAEAPGTGTPEHERQMVQGAIRTDLILSAEIMAIALAEVAAQPLLVRTLSLVVVAVVITALVYGVVAIIVKMDDVALLLAERPPAASQRAGLALVRAMPRVMGVLSTIGIAAMVWVGGHILLAGTDSLGWHGPYGAVHHVEESLRDHLPGVGGLLAWLASTLASALAGLAVGAVAVAAVLGVARLGPTTRKDHR